MQGMGCSELGKNTIFNEYPVYISEQQTTAQHVSNFLVCSLVISSLVLKLRQHCLDKVIVKNLFLQIIMFRFYIVKLSKKIDENQRY